MMFYVQEPMRVDGSMIANKIASEVLCKIQAFIDDKNRRFFRDHCDAAFPIFF